MSYGLVWHQQCEGWALIHAVKWWTRRRGETGRGRGRADHSTVPHTPPSLPPNDQCLIAYYHINSMNAEHRPGVQARQDGVEVGPTTEQSITLHCLCFLVINVLLPRAPTKKMWKSLKARGVRGHAPPPPRIFFYVNPQNSPFPWIWDPFSWTLNPFFKVQKMYI